MKKLFYIASVIIIFFSLLYFYLQTTEENFIIDYFSKGEQVVTDGLPDDNLEDVKNIQDESESLGLSIPNGFALLTYAEELKKVRDVILAQNGILVSSTNDGKVYYLPDFNNDNKADDNIVLLDKLNNPHGLLERCLSVSECKLYVAETHSVTVYDYDKERVRLSNPIKIIDLPDDGGHYTRSLALTEVNGIEKILITVGSLCNVCNEEDWRRAKILSSNLDGSSLEVFASGLRNSVFMEKNPNTGDIWATEMGRDWLGDNIPPEEVNIIKLGGNYGWPFCYGDRINDREFDKNIYIRDPCLDTVPPHITMQSHSAPLGLSFIPEEGWPEEYWHDLLVAQHGSWNSSVPVGYKIVRMKLDSEGNFSGEEDFITGFLKNGKAWGRPADVLASTDGSLYITDDESGRVYILIHIKK